MFFILLTFLTHCSALIVFAHYLTCRWFGIFDDQASIRHTEQYWESTLYFMKNYHSFWDASSSYSIAISEPVTATEFTPLVSRSKYCSFSRFAQTLTILFVTRESISTPSENVVSNLGLMVQSIQYNYTIKQDGAISAVPMKLHLGAPALPTVRHHWMGRT